MIIQETTPELINRISNMPEVLPFLSRHGDALDWSPVFEPGSGCMVLSNGEDACMVLEQTAPRHWQVSTIYAPSCRGKRAVETGQGMRDFMIPEHADMIFGSIPNSFKHAIWFYQKMGGVKVDEIESDGYIWHAQPGETLYALRGEE